MNNTNKSKIEPLDTPFIKLKYINIEANKLITTHKPTALFITHNLIKNIFNTIQA
ncbi:hypothetical protein NEIG_01446 [Nematocida sp. ERTm5]|nr:hypothetical protein NEIG_01446 [Nematocida sp. ERTm5]